jgi:hypothetical protein
MAYGFKLHKAFAPGDLVTCLIASGDGTRVGKGDPVKTAGSAGTIAGAGSSNYPTVIMAAVGDVIYGVVEGVLNHMVAGNMNLNQTHRPASTAMLVLVRIAHPLDEYVIQEDAVGGALAVTDIGLNASFIVTASCDVITGMSGVQLDTSTKATTNTLDCQIVNFLPSVSNAIGTQADVIVRLNNCRVSNQVAGA